MKTIYSIYKNAYTGLPRQVWELSGVVLINRAGSMVIMYMMLYLTQQIGVSVTTAGRIISIYGIGAIFGTLLGGWLSDVIGPQRVQLSSLFLTAVVFIVLAQLTDIYLIAGTMFMLSLVAEAFRPANSTAIAEVSPPEKRARAYALNRLAINLGFSIGPVIGGILARINYHYLFYVDALTCALAGFYLLFLYRRHGIAHQHHGKLISHARLPRHDAVYLSVLFLFFIIGMIFFQLFNVWPLHLKKHYGFFESHIGPLLAINGLLIVLMEMPLVHRLERAQPMQIIAVGALLICIGFGILPFGHSYLWTAFTVVIWTIGEMLCFPLTAAFIANRASDTNRGKYMGMYNFTFSASMVAAPAVGAWIYETYGPTVLWHGIGMTGFLLFGGFMVVNHFLKREKTGV